MLKKIIIIMSLIFLLGSCVAHSNRALTSNTTTTKTNHMKKKGGYIQNGKRYQIMKNSQHFKENGVASWYGRKFNKKHTSSGERFNMYKLTAAHKTLPLSTYVQVTNLTNGKRVVVRVNDRGPFVSNRIIDLSYAAAKKLGMVQRGVIPVAIKTINL